MRENTKHDTGLLLFFTVTLFWTWGFGILLVVLVCPGRIAAKKTHFPAKSTYLKNKKDGRMGADHMEKGLRCE